MVSTSGMPSLARSGAANQEVHGASYPGSMAAGVDERWPWHRDPATPCTALPPPTLVSRPDEKAMQWRNGELKPGDKVEYFSSTQNKYMAAQVVKVSEGQDGIISAVDLDCKKRAKPGLIRRIGKEHVLATERQEPAFRVGETVEYWSASHNQWMDALVEKVREDGFFDLNVKNGARPERMRHRQENGRRDPAPHTVKARVPRKSEAPVPSVVATSPPIGKPAPFESRTAPAAEGKSRPSDRGRTPGGGEGEPKVPSSTTGEPLDSSPSSTAQGAVFGVADSSSRLPSACVASVTNASPDSSPVAGSSVASSTTTVYRNLPANMLFLGTGIEHVMRRKPKRGADIVISGPLAGGEITFTDTFDAVDPRVRDQLLSLLGFSAKAKIERMTGFSGGLNDGIWFLSGSCGENESQYEELVLKLVRCYRIASNVPTEAENLVKVQRDHPEISRDGSLAFPIKIFSCSDGSAKKHDLIVMPKIPGERLAEVICRKFYNNQLPLLHGIFEKLGVALCEFHERYGKQHGDFQPSNIFYDDALDALYFIDIGGMGLPTLDTDVEHFREAMMLLAGAYSPTLHEELAEAFQRGYGS